MWQSLASSSSLAYPDAGTGSITTGTGGITGGAGAPAVQPPTGVSVRCSASTPGAWGGQNVSLSWHPATGSSDSSGGSCQYSISTPFDFLSRFAGRRLILIGDGLSRDFYGDFIGTLLGCVARTQWLPQLARHHRTQRQACNPAMHGTDRIGPQSEYARGVCDALRHDGTTQRNADFAVNVAVGTTGQTVELVYHWVPWWSNSRLLQSKWWNATINTGRFDAVLVNWYSHIAKRQVSDGTTAHYLGGVASLLEALDSSPPWLRDKLRKRFYWRATFPTEWTRNHSPQLRPAAVAHASSLVSALWTGRGFPLLDLSKYFVHGSCERKAQDSGPQSGCVTVDGIHVLTTVNLATAREAWSVIADAMDAEEGGPLREDKAASATGLLAP